MNKIQSFVLGLVVGFVVASVMVAVAQAPPAPPAQAPQLTEEKLFAQLGRLNAQLALQGEYISTLTNENTALKAENKKLNDELAKLKGPKKETPGQ